MHKWIYRKSGNLVFRDGFDLKRFKSESSETDWDQRYTLRYAGNQEKFPGFNEDKREVYEYIAGTIRKLFGDRKQLKILELACGTADCAFELLAQGYQVKMSDYSESLVHKFLKPKLESLGFTSDLAFVADVTDLSNIDEKFDVIYCSGLYGFNNIFSSARAYGEIHKCLSDKGVFIHWVDSFANGHVRLMTAFPFRWFVNMKYLLLSSVGLLGLWMKSNELVRKLFGKGRVEKVFFERLFYGWIYDRKTLLNMIEANKFTVEDVRYLDVARGKQRYLGDLKIVSLLWNALAVRSDAEMYAYRLIITSSCAKNSH